MGAPLLPILLDDGLHTQVTIGAELKKAVLAAARCVAMRLCAQIGRTHVFDQIMKDLRARAQAADARTNALVREKMAQVACAGGKPEDMKRAAEQLERAIESLKRAKSNWDSAAPHGAADA